MCKVTSMYLLSGLVFLCSLVGPHESFAAQGDPYVWPEYNPTISYNFKNDNPGLAMPAKDLDDCSNLSGRQSSGWWTFVWGPSKNSLVTTASITPLLARMNKDFAFFRDTMGWPPDARAQNGYRSAIYLYGSGLCTDNASNTDLGGWQSAIGAYPMVLLSYYPVYCFDPACTYSDKVTQQGGCVHEGIHCVLAGLPGCKQAAWFQEGGNTWLQQQAAAMQTNDYSTMGFLNGTTFLAPFMPIECYSGWLQDGSFGGPSAEGVNMYASLGGAQICTWRNYLGGNQYGNAFPTFLGEWLGLGSVPWIWKNCPGRVLEGIAGGLGDAQTRRLITEYRAKQALIDMKQWSNAFKALLNGYFGTSIIPEGDADNMANWINCAPWTATPYAKTTNDGSGLLTPDQLTTPGWSGANQVPLKVSGTMATVNFQPVGPNMTCQLCYRATDGTPVYSTPVSSGACSLRLDKAPGSNVVIAVICNTDYKYLGDTTRKAHYDYRLQLGTGVTGAADVNTKWYNVNLPVSVGPSPQNASVGKLPGGGIYASFEGRDAMTISYSVPIAGEISLSVFTLAGALVKKFPSAYKQPGVYAEKVDVADSRISKGTYVVQLKTKKGFFYDRILYAR